MPRAEPLITPEELQCLLGVGTSASATPPQAAPLSSHPIQPLRWGALLWMVKGIVLYLVFFWPDASSLASAGRYFWMRGAMEMLCLSVFWGAVLHPRGQATARGAILVASTTLVMDLMKLLALP
jgi:hypothetical protein